VRVSRLLLLERLAHARGHGGALLLALVEHAPCEPLVPHVDLDAVDRALHALALEQLEGGALGGRRHLVRVRARVRVRVGVS